MLFLIDYESSRWCGGRSNCVVDAPDEDEAEFKAGPHMEEAMRDLFSDEYEEEDEDDDSAYSVNSVTPFDPAHAEWKWFIHPEQTQFYPLVGD